jgi:hypothetical protein
MTLSQINECLKASTELAYTLKGTQYDVNYREFAHSVAALVRKEMLDLCRANMVLSNSATELYKDLQAYDRFEQNFNF